MTYFTSDEFAEASGIVARHMAPTPQFVWPLLNESVGTEVWVKHENCTPTGAFKVRGGLVYIDRLVRERPEVRGVVSATPAITARAWRSPAGPQDCPSRSSRLTATARTRTQRCVGSARN